MSALRAILDTFRAETKSKRDQGTQFEDLIALYLHNEPRYKDLYSDVWTYADWARGEGREHVGTAADAGIDLVAKTSDGKYHAIQCKFYSPDHTISKADIDSFFTASGKTWFTHRLIVASTNKWSGPAEDALSSQQSPVTKIDLTALEDSRIDWSRFKPSAPVKLKRKYRLRPHQADALNSMVDKFADSDRGKLIMACGTGKTFAALRIAERLAQDGRVLYLVPSLALLSQTLSEWTQQAEHEITAFAVCSDSAVGKRRSGNAEHVDLFAYELSYPVTTTPERLASEMAGRHRPGRMSVVFSTYHSIGVLHEAQAKQGLPDFDLIMCDEAHRTTGATFAGEDESHFVRVHDDDYIHGAKRLYMTATPRIYGDTAKGKAEQLDAALCSMDDKELYGDEMHVLSFSESVSRGLLVDYKVVVLAVDEGLVSQRLQRMFADDENQIRVDDAAKIIGCWKALSKEDLQGEPDASLMQRAVAFCQVIDPKPKSRTHKVSSKHIASNFGGVVKAWQTSEGIEGIATCEAEHIDGTMNADAKSKKLAWLKSEIPENACRVLSNVRCLSEGVDVPALDAVLFLTPRNSQVDVVQSVGRVMRNAPGKQRGYVILPVVIPSGVEPHVALNDNATYRVVWQVLQALRSHDDHFDAFVNKIDLQGGDNRKMEIIAITDRLAGPKRDTGRSGDLIGKPQPKVSGADPEPVQIPFHFEPGEIERAIYAKVVQKCGRRLYWEDWATDIAKIAQTHIARITAIVSNPNNAKESQTFRAFTEELRDDLNDSITDDEVIEMLAQHLITRPVFDALFEGAAFADRNPVSVSMQNVLDVLERHRLDKEAETLNQFYESVAMRAAGIDAIEGKQRIVVELYDKFFRKAFPRLTERLGIVYTPVEVVDFIIHSVNDLLQSEFGQTLGSEDVHILDPFTGTGTFITRLLQSGLISKEDLPRKYKSEIHANEIVLLAYYIAAINIEAVYHGLVGSDYTPFEGICLTDTFQMGEQVDMLADFFEDNSKRRTRQAELDIRVIIGNPPYSAGQKSANENAQNVKYPKLDAHIEDTYARHSQAINKNSLYDSYIRAIRWGSDRLGDAGVMAYVTNAGWINSNSADGLRKCLAEEFSSLYVFHLRGNQRTQGERSRREGGKIFGQGSRAPIAITLLVRNPKAAKHGQIHFHDIGDYLSRVDKLRIVKEFGSVRGVTERGGWRRIQPDGNHDWLDQVSTEFDQFLALGDKKSKSVQVFENYSCGVKTQRDAWCYNASKPEVDRDIRSMIAFYHSERARYQAGSPPANADAQAVSAFINSDPTRISWTGALKQDFARNKDLEFSEGEILQSAYRPFSKQWMYYGRRLNERVYQMPQIFPNGEARNKVICVTGVGATAEFSTLIVNAIPNLHTLDSGQCFPLYLYERIETSKHSDLFSIGAEQPEHRMCDGISDAGLEHFRAAYPGEPIDKEGLFHYVYGLLHSEDYRDRFRNNLMKQIPRIPAVIEFADFDAFRSAGEELAALHLGYESVEPWPVTINDGKSLPAGIETQRLYRVEKMRFASKDDLSTIIYNPHITISDIPPEAYEYVVNGKPAVKWVMERQGVRTDKTSGIVNDANRYAVETMGDPAYPLDLLKRVIRVSVETVRIVNSLPTLHLPDSVGSQ